MQVNGCCSSLFSALDGLSFLRFSNGLNRVCEVQTSISASAGEIGTQIRVAGVAEQGCGCFYKLGVFFLGSMLGPNF